MGQAQLLRHAKDFLYKNARLLDRKRYEYYYEGGSKEEVINVGEELQDHLQVLIEQQQEDGGWPISWPALSAGTELEWRGWVTVERLRTLKSYGII
jgi:hypothetical protein